MTLYLLKVNLKLKVKSIKELKAMIKLIVSNLILICFIFFIAIVILKVYFLQADVVEMKPKIQKKREMDEDSTDTKKIKTDEKILDVRESEPIISSKEISSKKNVCLFNILIIYKFL